MAKRVTSIGGQALLEGILMVGPKKNVAAFCDEAGNITTEEVSTPSLREKYPILKKPFIRGVFSMVDTLRLGMKALTLSADKVAHRGKCEEAKALPPALRLQLYDLNAFARHHHRFFHSVFQSVPAHIL